MTLTDRQLGRVVAGWRRAVASAPHQLATRQHQQRVYICQALLGGLRTTWHRGRGRDKDKDKGRATLPNSNKSFSSQQHLECYQQAGVAWGSLNLTVEMLDLA